MAIRARIVLGVWATGSKSDATDSALAPGVPARQSHDYERHGVTSLFAAMDVASGVTISHCYRRHRHQEFPRFLNEIEENLPVGPEVHLILDNYGTHKVTQVKTWLKRHPRYHVHFAPTSGIWLNLVERLFAEVTERCVRRGSHTAIVKARNSHARLSGCSQQKTQPLSELPTLTDSWQNSPTL